MFLVHVYVVNIHIHCNVTTYMFYLQLYFDEIRASLLSVEECKSLGFAPNLVCSQCNELDQFNLSQLTESCNNCCQKDGDDDNTLKVSQISYMY